MAASIPDEIRASLAAPLGRLAGLDPVSLIIQSNQSNDTLLEAQGHIAALRRGAVRQLRSEGFTLKDIGEAVGVKPQRIHQIEAGYDRHERQRRQQQ